MVHVYIKHEIESYEKWKPAFDAVHEMRKAAGEQESQLFHLEGKPNMLIALVSWDNLENAKAFFNNPKLHAIMQEAGVIGKPEIEYLESY